MYSLTYICFTCQMNGSSMYTAILGCWEHFQVVGSDPGSFRSSDFWHLSPLILIRKVVPWKQIDLNFLRQFFLLWPLGEIGMVSGWKKSEEGIVVVWFWSSRSHQRFGKIELSGFKSLNLDGSGSTFPPDVSPIVVLFQISRPFFIEPIESGSSPRYPGNFTYHPFFPASFESMIFYRPVWVGAFPWIFFTGRTQGSAAFEEQRCSLAFKGAQDVSIFGGDYIHIYIYIYGDSVYI